MNNKKKGGKGTSIAVWIIIAATLFYSFFSSEGYDAEDFLPIVIVAVITMAVVLNIVVFKKLKTGKNTAKKPSSVELNRPFPQPTALKTKQPPHALHHKDEAEEALTCAHRTGREKYLEQAESFYRNGLIDRAEYKTLREKYEKMDIPEDYH